MQISIIISVLITITSIAKAQRGPTAIYNPSFGHVLKRIPSDEFIKSGHTIRSNTHLKLLIKPDSTIDGRYYKRPTGIPLPLEFLQVISENGAMKPIMRMGYGFAPNYKKLNSVLLQFSSRQELDDFVAELELEVTESSGSKSSKLLSSSSANTSKITSDAFKSEGHRIHSETILDIKIKRNSKLEAGLFKSKNKNSPRWLEVIHNHKAMAPRLIIGYGQDDANLLLNFLVRFPNRQELDDFVAKLELKVKSLSLK